MRAAFVDRDGVVNNLVEDRVTAVPESPLRVEDVVLAAGAADALRRLASDGWVLVGVSNQPAAAKGIVPVGQLQAVHERVLELLAARGVQFDDFRVCLHHPDGLVPELSGACDCRKPAPGMLLRASWTLGIDLKRSWMIGDADSDVVAGRRAGCRTVLVEHPSSAHKRTGVASADAVASSLDAAAALLVEQEVAA